MLRKISMGLSVSQWATAWSRLSDVATTPMVLASDQLLLSPPPASFEVAVDLSLYQALAIMVLYDSGPVEFRALADVGGGALVEIGAILVSATGVVTGQGNAIEYDPYTGEVDVFLDLSSVVAGTLQFVQVGVTEISFWTE